MYLANEITPETCMKKRKIIIKYMIYQKIVNTIWKLFFMKKQF